MRPGDQLAFCVLPRGGGGQGGSNPLRTLLTLALAVMAPGLGATLLGAQTAGTVIFGSFTRGNAVGLGAMLLGQSVINALMPLPKPVQLPTASPTYALGAQGNIARIEQAIPVQYGRMLAWPDFAAQPYAEYAGTEQYLYQLLCLGCGAFDIEQIRIEDTPISAFPEITYDLRRSAQRSGRDARSWIRDVDCAADARDQQPVGPRQPPYICAVHPQGAGLGWCKLVCAGCQPSLLPAFKGKGAIQAALDAGQRVTGGTIYWLIKSVDSGPVVMADRAAELWRRALAPNGVELICAAVAALIDPLMGA